MNQKFSLLQDIPASSKDEIFETILQKENIKIERIISYGQTTPENYWYDQDEDEFVVVLQGFAKLQYYDGNIIELNAGDSLLIKAHEKHKVIYTENPTIWLAIFFKG